MVQAMMGTDEVLYFRKLGSTESGTLVLQTEHSKSASREREKTPTKFGSVSRKGLLEEEVTISALQATDDPYFHILQDAVYDDYPMEVWAVKLNKATTETGADGTTEVTKYEGEYRQGFITSWEESSNSEEEATVEGTFMTEGKRKKGLVTLSADQIKELEYVFHDMTAEDVPEDGLASMVSPQSA